MSTATTEATRHAQVLDAVRRMWGYDSLRPLQAEAMEAELAQRDSVVVLPTGGGKSLCYQVPPLLAERTDVVVSPLIALMKDQIDGLRTCGYPAAALHSHLERGELDSIVEDLRGGKYRLLLVSPERLIRPGFLGLLAQVGVQTFAVDEAHCISHWGHDFRPEYRQLALLKERFPGASVHAYTATATERVREDIVTQLGLQQPTMLVGVFDRPNLSYRVVPRVDVHAQAEEVIKRHPGEAVIVYCLSRRDSELMAANLSARGIKAEPYHAGMSAHARRRTQDAFAAEKLNVVTATVAFGMGIDRSNVRCVIHATLPKSVEHYQQETGRAGRDGLEAECVLFYSASDVMRWERLLKRNTDDEEVPAEVFQAAQVMLAQMRRYASAPVCRHRALSEYFGQAYPKDNCGACDVCLNDVAGTEDATVVAQQIISCVARMGERFGSGRVADVLVEADTEQVRQWRHHELSTYGLLKDTPRNHVMNWTLQLVDQGLLERTTDDRPVLKLNAASWEVLRGQRRVNLIKVRKGRVKQTTAERESWEGVDQGLFEHLRQVRKELAEERLVPAFVIFGDAALRDMARRKPKSKEEFLAVHGVGSVKLQHFGRRFVDEIKAYGARQESRAHE